MNEQREGVADILRPAAAFALGAVSVLAFEPYGAGLVFPAALSLLLTLTLTSRSASGAFLLTFLFAFAMNSFGLWWIHVSMTEFSGVPMIAAVLAIMALAAYLALYPALAAFLSSRLFGRMRAVRAMLAFPALLFFANFLMGSVMTGFPWLMPGYTQESLPFIGYAPLAGEKGITVLLASSAGAIACFVLSIRKRRAWLFLLLPAVLTIAGAALSGNLYTAEQKKVRAALMQGNIPQAIKWNPEEIVPTLRNYELLSKPYVIHPGTVDLIIWPESAIPALEHILGKFLGELSAIMKDSRIGFITGFQHYEPENLSSESGGRYYNGVVGMGLIDTEGKMSYVEGEGNRYYKRHLVPIGEFVPFPGILRKMGRFFNMPMSSFTRGDEIQPNFMAHGLNVSTAICYEIAFPEEMRVNLHDDTDFILTVSNDSWFGHSDGPVQHLTIARMRALEFQKPLLRVTNGGITAAFSARGQELGRIGLDRRGVLEVAFRPARGSTPYQRFGDWPLTIICLAALAISLIARRLCEERK